MTETEHHIRPNDLERHTQTLLVMVLVALLVWVGSTTQKTAVAVAQMSVEIGHLKSEVEKPNGKFVEIERRLDNIERQLDQIQRGQNDEP